MFSASAFSLQGPERSPRSSKQQENARNGHQVKRAFQLNSRKALFTVIKVWDALPGAVQDSLSLGASSTQPGDIASPSARGVIPPNFVTITVEILLKYQLISNNAQFKGRAVPKAGSGYFKQQSW